MAANLTNDFNEYEGLSKLFEENNLVESSGSPIDDQIRDIEKSRLRSNIGVKNKKRNIDKKKSYRKNGNKQDKKGSSYLKEKKQIDPNRNIKQLDKKILDLLEQRRNIQRMRARREHGDPNWVSQGTKNCRHFDSRTGCEYKRGCNMKHPTIVSDVNAAIIEFFITAINAPTEDQVAFLERNKKRPQQFYSRGKNNPREKTSFHSHDNALYQKYQKYKSRSIGKSDD